MLSEGEEIVNNEEMKEHKEKQKQMFTNILAQNWFSGNSGLKDALSAGWNSSDCDTNNRSDGESNYEVSENEWNY